MKDEDEFPFDSLTAFAVYFAILVIVIGGLALMIGSPALLIYMVLSWNGVI